ncbi:MAG: carbohydrate ABC transporter permease [bacterium]
MNERLLKQILLYVGSLIIVGFCMLPFCWMIIVSLAERPDLLITERFTPTIHNYADIIRIRSLHFTDYLRNSFVISGISSFLLIAIALIAAYGVSRLRFRGKGFVSMFILAFSTFPQISIVAYLYRFTRSLGLTNTYLALIMPYIAWSIPLGFWLLLTYLSRIPDELDNAAIVDGASRLKIMRSIILPVALPGILSATLLAFIACFNEFLFALMLTSDHKARTIPVGIALFQGLHGELPWGYIMAASTLASIPIVTLAFIFQRYIIQDITRGALKQ